MGSIFNSHDKTVYLFKPKPYSNLTGLIGYLKNINVNYVDIKKTLGNQGTGREITRCESFGELKLSIISNTIELRKYGFSI